MCKDDKQRGQGKQYRVWRYNRRRNTLYRVQWKHLSAHDKANAPAVWRTQQAARDYVRRNPDVAVYGFVVMQE